MTPYEMVLEFHTAFGCEINAPWTQELLELRESLLREEVTETCSAITEGDLVETLDGLGDIIYVTVGAAIALGTSIRTPTPPRPLGEPRITRTGSVVENLRHRFNRCRGQFWTGDVVSLGLGLQDVYDTCLAIADEYNLPLQAALEEIHRSNMAKLVDGVVIRNSIGKVQKPAGWTAPDIASLLNIKEAA